MSKDEKTFRPVIDSDQTDRVKKLSNDFNLSSQKLVNFFVNIGCECMERAMPKLEDQIKSKFKELLRDFEK